MQDYHSHAPYLLPVPGIMLLKLHHQVRTLALGNLDSSQ
jgi:hypothetical protein